MNLPKSNRQFGIILALAACAIGIPIVYIFRIGIGYYFEITFNKKLLHDVVNKVQSTDMPKKPVVIRPDKLRGNFIIVFDELAGKIQSEQNLQRLGPFSIKSFCKNDPEYYSQCEENPTAYSHEEHCCWEGYAFGPSLSHKPKKIPKYGTIVLIKAIKNDSKTYLATEFNGTTFNLNSQKTIDAWRYSYDVFLIDVKYEKIYAFRQFPAPHWPERKIQILHQNLLAIHDLTPIYEWVNFLWRRYKYL